jgi:hypothetical protein
LASVQATEPARPREKRVLEGIATIFSITLTCLCKRTEQPGAAVARFAPEPPARLHERATFLMAPLRCHYEDPPVRPREKTTGGVTGSANDDAPARTKGKKAWRRHPVKRPPARAKGRMADEQL